MQASHHESLNIPSSPGVYFFMKEKEILYIGKATQLKQRTRSYFTPTLMETRGPIIVKMVEEATTISYTTTDSVLEALLLESYLIKKHQPPYNSKEKDDKSYNYVVITDEPLPRVYPVRKRELAILVGKKQKLLHTFGPFPQGNLLRTALQILRKIFPFYGKNGVGSYAHQFYMQLGLEPSNTSSLQTSYQENIAYLALFFQGKKTRIINILTKKMMTYAKDLAFEQAQAVKRQIYALEHIQDIALMKRDFELGTDTTSIRIEAYDIAHLQGQDMVGVMVVHNGREISNQDHRIFTIRSTTTSHDPLALKEVLTRRLAHTQWPYPALIVVDGGTIQKRVMEKVLHEHGLTIPVVSVVKDDRHQAKGILGQKKLITKYQHEIMSIHAESHRFAINAHKKKRNKRFLDL